MEKVVTHKLIEWGVVERPLVGYPESGDQCLVKSFPNGILIAVIDGLGHGDKASQVAKDAVEAIKDYAHNPVDAIMKRCHEALRGSRGVVMTLVSFNGLDHTMTWLGVGNVEGILLRAKAREGRTRETALLRGGVLGYQIPTLRPMTLPVAQGDTLVLATDGIRSSFSQNIPTNGAPQQIAEHIMTEHSRKTDDALVLVARYLKG
jgi:serine/threonine protein phosphatase PrpC